MPRSWVRLAGAGGRRTICCTLPTSTCFNARLSAPPGDDALAAAADEINRVLDRVRQQNPDPTRDLAILAVPGQDGEDQLELDWIATDIEVATPLDLKR
jgi:hypothetical protein